MTAEYLNKSRKMPEYLIKVAVYVKKFQFQSIVSNHSKAADGDSSEICPTDNQEKDPEISVITEKDICERVAKEEEQKKNKKYIERAKFDSNLSFLNSLAFFALFLIIFWCDLAFWILIGI